MGGEQARKVKYSICFVSYKNDTSLKNPFKQRSGILRQ